MTKQEFKNIIPKASAEDLVKLGFGYIASIKRSFRPIWMQIPKKYYDSIPKGFIIVTKYLKEEKFNPEIHKRDSNGMMSDYLDIGLQRKDTLSPKN